MKPAKTLLPLNGQLRIAGETFLSPQIGFDLELGVLYLQHPWLGEMILSRTDDLRVYLLDLEIPTIIRMLHRSGGWEPMTLPQLFQFVTASCAAQEG